MDKNEIKKIDDLYNLLRIKPKALEDIKYHINYDKKNININKIFSNRNTLISNYIY